MSSIKQSRCGASRLLSCDHGSLLSILYFGCVPKSAPTPRANTNCRTKGGGLSETASLWYFELPEKRSKIHRERRLSVFLEVPEKCHI